MTPLRSIGLGVAVIATCGVASGLGAGPMPAEPPSRVIVRFDPGASVAQRARALDAVDAVHADAVRGVPRMQVLHLPEDDSPASAARRLRAVPGVAWAVPDGWSRLATVPNDPQYPSLWGMPAIGAPSVWDSARGSASVRVGVVDSGIAPSHPDLAANEVPSLGRNFVPPGGSGAVGTRDPTAWDDLNGHGTHVAGTIGAVGNNGLGVTGVNWSSGLIAARAMDVSGLGSNSSIAEALAWAAANARVVNASIGGPSDVPEWEAVFRAYPNTLFAVAAGNDGVNNDDPGRASFPCASPAPNVLCVAALDNANALADFSNWGASTVDLGAPGVAVNSTYIPLEVRDDQSSAAAMAGWTASPAPAWMAGMVGSTPVTETANASATASGDIVTTLELAPLATLTGSACRITVPVWAGTAPGAPGLTFELQVQDPGDLAWYQATPSWPLDTGGYFEPVTAELSPLDGQSGVRMRLAVRGTGTVSFSTRTGTFAAVAGATASCMVPQSPAGSYAVDSGTSMATPHVAGAAAMILSARPDLTAAEVKTAILSTTTPTASLAGRTVTGGRLNLAAAMASLPQRATPAPATPATPQAAPPAPSIALRRGTITRRLVRGRVSLPLACEGQAPSRCIMAISLRAGRRVVGSLNVALPAGWRGSAGVPLNRAGRVALGRSGRLGVTVRVAPRDGAPGVTSTGRMRIIGR